MFGVHVTETHPGEGLCKKNKIENNNYKYKFNVIKTKQCFFPYLLQIMQ